MKKKILLTLAIFVAVFAAASILKVNALAAVNMWGWSWGGTEDDTIAGMIGTVDGNETGVGWISMNNLDGGGAYSYGVNIPSSDGVLSGYGWSANVGWVSFNSADVSGCPDAPNPCNARRVGDNLEGWARIIGIRDAGANAGGWQGWIKLAGTATNGSPYGVFIDPSTGDFCGAGSCYAWSDELGWIDFSYASTDPSLPPVLNVSLVASPDYCVDFQCGGTLSPTLTASVLGTSTTTGTVSYEFDCDDSDGVTFTDGVYIDVNSLTQDHTGCVYNGVGAYTATARITQEGISETITDVIRIDADYCGNNQRGPSEECDEGTANAKCADDPTATCSDSCTLIDCSRDGLNAGPFREVAP